jgi:GTPase
VAVSAKTGAGLAELFDRLAAILPPPGSDEAVVPAGVVVHRLEPAAGSFSVLREGDGYRVRGRRIERLVAQTDFDNEESAERFQRDLARLGIDRELRRAGVAEGDTVRIGSHELAWGDEPWA